LLNCPRTVSRAADAVAGLNERLKGFFPLLMVGVSEELARILPSKEGHELEFAPLSKGGFSAHQLSLKAVAIAVGCETRVDEALLL
jgi:hypothetical protein